MIVWLSLAIFLGALIFLWLALQYPAQVSMVLGVSAFALLIFNVVFISLSGGVQTQEGTTKTTTLNSTATLVSGITTTGQISTTTETPVYQPIPAIINASFIMLQLALGLWIFFTVFFFKEEK